MYRIPNRMSLISLRVNLPQDKVTQFCVPSWVILSCNCTTLFRCCWYLSESCIFLDNYRSVYQSLGRCCVEIVELTFRVVSVLLATVANDSSRRSTPSIKASSWIGSGSGFPYIIDQNREEVLVDRSASYALLFWSYHEKIVRVEFWFDPASVMEYPVNPLTQTLPIRT